MKWSSPVLVLILYLLSTSAYTQTPMPNAHAHNDYEHKRPLLDALEQGFTSVEADVWLIKGQLYVYHDLPERPSENRRLEELYLKPLLNRVTENQGNVYPGYTDTFYLMIDFKSEAVSTYEALLPLLKKYHTILDPLGKREEAAVKVFISGNRPVVQLLEATSPMAALDGRPEDLGKGISTTRMPVVSQSIRKFTNWRGGQAMNKADQKKISAFIEAAHSEGKKVRFWANPDTEEGWQMLLDLGVDFINTDRLKELSTFLKNKD